MASHLQTQNLKLPLYEANDTPSWLQDWNETMQKLDYYCSTLNSRLYDYVNTLDSINNKLTEDRKILEEALATSKEARDLAVAVNNSLNAINKRIDNLESSVDERFDNIGNEIISIKNNIQNIYNLIAALDTKLDNAISGGDIVAPFTTNLLLLPYTPYIVPANAGGTDYYPEQVSNTANSFHWLCPETRTYAVGHYGRTYQPVLIKGSTARPCFIKANLSFNAQYKRDTIQGAWLHLMEGNTILHTIEAQFASDRYSASIAVNLNINQWKDKNVSVRIDTAMGTGDYAHLDCAINQLVISNQ